MRRLLLRVLATLGLLAVTLLLAACAVGPRLVDRALNRTGPYRGSQASERARRLVAGSQLADLHADTLLWGRPLLERQAVGHVDLPRLVEGHVALQAFTVVTTFPVPPRQAGNRHDAGDLIGALAWFSRWPGAARQDPYGRALFQAERLREAVEQSRGGLFLVRTRGDLEQLRARRAAGAPVVGALLGLEGMQSLGSDLGRLETLFKAGFRMAAPSHFTDTLVGGSAHGEEGGGLTPLGERWVDEMERLGLLIDLAHASPRTFAEVIARSHRPVLVSHTGVAATCPGPRNLTDDQLRAVARTGGVIGIAYFSVAVCGKTPGDIARAIAHAVEVVGPDHVALGSDFDGAVATPFDTTGIPVLVDALLAEGLGEAAVQQVLGENTLRLLARLLPE